MCAIQLSQIGAIVQARMGSQRFPGKVLHKVRGKALLQYILERIEQSCCSRRVVIATSSDESDNAIAEFCEVMKVPCSRGSLLDVAGRFGHVLSEWNFDAFVRVNGDSPLLDQRLIDKGVKIFLENDCELVTNVNPRTYPAGQSVEIVAAGAFKQAYDRMTSAEELEHVTKFFYNNPRDIRILNFEAEENLRSAHLAVDTQEDMSRFEAIVAFMERPHWEYDVCELLSLNDRVSQLDTSRIAAT